MTCLPTTSGSPFITLLLVGLALAAVGTVALLAIRRGKGAVGAVMLAVALGLTAGVGAVDHSPAYAESHDCPPEDSSAPAPEPSTPASPSPSTSPSPQPSPSPTSSPSPSPTPSPTPPPVEPFAMSSLAWSGSTVPEENACDVTTFDFGISPDVSWSDAPAGTVAFAVTLIDLDTSPTFKHWTVINIPNSETGLAAGASGSIAPPAEELMNDFGQPGYGGPCPPPGETHDYQLTVHALSQTVTSADEIAAASIESVSLTSSYTS